MPSVGRLLEGLRRAVPIRDRSRPAEEARAGERPPAVEHVLAARHAAALARAAARPITSGLRVAARVAQ